MRGMAVPRCPICQRSVAAVEPKVLPFCSDRCRQVDLGRWLGGDYRIPVRTDDEDEDGDGAVRRPDER